VAVERLGEVLAHIDKVVCVESLSVVRLIRARAAEDHLMFVLFLLVSSQFFILRPQLIMQLLNLLVTRVLLLE